VGRARAARWTGGRGRCDWMKMGGRADGHPAGPVPGGGRWSRPGSPIQRWRARTARRAGRRRQCSPAGPVRIWVPAPAPASEALIARRAGW